MIGEDWLRFTVSSVRKSSALLMKRSDCYNLTFFHYHIDLLVTDLMMSSIISMIIITAVM